MPSESQARFVRSVEYLPFNPTFITTPRIRGPTGYDNLANSLWFDEGDPFYYSSQVTISGPIQGTLEGLEILAEYWMQECDYSFCGGADLTKDLEVNLADFAELSRIWFNDQPLAASDPSEQKPVNPE